MFSEKAILITGGTGTIGQYVVQKLVHTNCKKIVIFSRDEEKQYTMQQQYSDERLDYVIGDIRDYQRLEHALLGIDYIIHAAAMKQVPLCEKNPMEAVATNIIGTHNLILGANRQQVKKVICLSSDKSVSPSNCMGMTKGIEERLIRVSSSMSRETEVICVRLGNVLGSRGSVIPLWKQQIEKHGRITLTDKRMTRFIMTYEDVFQLLKHVILFGRSGEIVVSNMKACCIWDLAKAMCLYHGLNAERNIVVIGARPGEKLFEELFSLEEKPYVYPNKCYYHIGSVNTHAGETAILRKSDECNHLSVVELYNILEENHIF